MVFISKVAVNLTNSIPGLRNRAFFVSDLILLPACAVLAFAARFEGPWDASITSLLYGFVARVAAAQADALLFVLGMYRRLWRYASVSATWSCSSPPPRRAPSSTCVLGLALLPRLAVDRAPALVRRDPARRLPWRRGDRAAAPGGAGAGATRPARRATRRFATRDRRRRRAPRAA